MQNLKAARNAKGYTQEQLADLLNITRLSVARYEAGDREPSISILKKMADVLETSTDFLLGREKTMREILDEDPDTAQVSTVAAHYDGEITEELKREIARQVKEGIEEYNKRKSRS